MKKAISNELADFVPFDVEKLFTERLLKAVDIDPKLMKEIC